ncbi:coiled-coil domain-containing protein 12-like [Stegodyphus dumicola]|uniref:coiled-coil domain-containing protein 12-like n=1 Tax=Stegodyphus dumicola TaxID=202533 RepID=UPI0015A85683|nr:coiled-coil domain-containing protein 12-like [Stegodyphus dumicola]
MELGSGKLMEEAQKRREKLANLRRRVEEQSDTQNDAPEVELPKPIFRNYTPNDDDLRNNQLPKAKPESVEVEIKDHLEATKPEPLIDEVDLSTLAPRKPDWDLKRDVAKKLEKLERRTQKAIAELIRERLKSNECSLVDAVSYAEATVATNDSDED